MPLDACCVWLCCIISNCCTVFHWVYPPNFTDLLPKSWKPRLSTINHLVPCIGSLWTCAVSFSSGVVGLECTLFNDGGWWLSEGWSSFHSPSRIWGLLYLCAPNPTLECGRTPGSPPFLTGTWWGWESPSLDFSLYTYHFCLAGATLCRHRVIARLSNRNWGTGHSAFSYLLRPSGVWVAEEGLRTAPPVLLCLFPALA